jgi:hypothetical protein
LLSWICYWAISVFTQDLLGHAMNTKRGSQIKAPQVLRDDPSRHDDGGTPVGKYAHGRLAEGVVYLSQGPLHALPVALPKLVFTPLMSA